MTVTGQAASPPVPDPAAAGSAVQTPGSLLQQERIRRGLSVQQSAEALHLDTWIIEAIEVNHFLALGAPVYARGYLRKYAVLLGLAPDVIVTRYEALSDTPCVPTPVPVITTTPPVRPKWPKYVAWGVVALVVFSIGFVVFQLLAPSPVVPIVGSSTSEAAPATSIVESRGTSAETAPVAATPVAVETPPPAPVARPSAPAAAVPPQARVAEPTAVPASPAVRLRLEFSEPSWVEVYDANGGRLLYDIGQPNRPRVVSGEAPLNVVVGLAAAVTVQVNDQTIVVPRQANRDSTRFRVGTDGSVR